MRSVPGEPDCKTGLSLDLEVVVGKQVSFLESAKHIVVRRC